MAGVSRLQYTSEIRLIRVMCSGRVDLEFILKAFLNGQDGVMIGGCRLNECNYITHGNYDALSNVLICKKILSRIGVNPDRLSIEFMSGADGNLLAEITDEFTQKIKALGPLGEGEGVETDDIQFKLKAVKKLIPYIKLVERERLRVPTKSQESYQEFFESDAFERLFDELIGEKMVVSQMISLLGNSPMSTNDISAKLGLSPSEVSRHIKSSSQQGFVRFDTASNCYMLA